MAARRIHRDATMLRGALEGIFGAGVTCVATLQDTEFIARVTFSKIMKVPMLRVLLARHNGNQNDALVRKIGTN